MGRAERAERPGHLLAATDRYPGLAVAWELERRRRLSLRQRCTDPAVFFREVLRAFVWSGMERMIAAMSRPRAQVAVAGCNASGKSWCAGALAVWWSWARRGRCVTTAPTGTQVGHATWREVRQAYQAAKWAVGGEVAPAAPLLRFSGGGLAYGRAMGGESQFQGEHGDVLVIVDEAPGMIGIKADVYAEIDGIRAGADVRVLLLGNPTVNGGTFYDALAGRGGWEGIRLDAFGTPNFEPLVRGVDVAGTSDDDLAQLLDEAGERGREAAVSAPYLVTPEWALGQWRKVDGNADHVDWAARVRGRFPGTPEGGLYSMTDVDAARDRRAWDDGGPLVVGLDVAGEGRAETSIHVCCRGNGAILDAWHSAGADAVFEAPSRLERWLPRLASVNYDEVGVGHFTRALLRPLKDRGVRVRGVNAGRAARDKSSYVNLKAEMYDALRERLRAGDVAGLTDPVTRRQLLGVRCDRLDPRGRLRIEGKAAAERRGEVSPDRAESLILAFAEPGGGGILTIT